jgi:lipid II:glycine glycyltransferase (peptidoglycan interpeptide bridge formation enzyme)
VAAQPAGDPLQAWGWGEVAAIGGEAPLRLMARDDAGRVRAVVQLLVRDTSFGRRIVYAPHGPVVERLDAATDAVLTELLAGIRRTGVAERAVVIKLDPRATDDRSAAVWRSTLEAHGLIRARNDLQARTTRLIDVGQGAEALFRSYDSDTRNKIRRGAREGIARRILTQPDSAALAAFRTLLLETGSRAGIRVRSAQAFEKLATEFGAAGTMRLVLIDLSGETIAGCLGLLSGNRAFYLYAASRRDPELRHARAAYAALWALCEEVAAAGAQSLDLWGVAEPGDTTADPSWAGFSEFKRAFGGEPLEHPGTFDLVISEKWYRLRDLRERFQK